MPASRPVVMQAEEFGAFLIVSVVVGPEQRGEAANEFEATRGSFGMSHKPHEATAQLSPTKL